MRLKRIHLHLFFWLAYLLFESYIEFAWIGSSYASMPVFSRWGIAFLAELSLLPAKLFSSYFIIYLISRPVKLPLSLLLGSLVLATSVVVQRLVIVKFLLPYIYREPAENSLLFNTQRIISSLVDLIFVVGLAVAFKQYRVSQAAKARQKELTKEKLEAELKFLRTQTNPHFLFNTLNNIYALARKKSDDTAGAVMKLSKLLRFMLYESGHHYISLKKEIQVLKDYIELEKIRYNERLHIRFEEDIDNGQQQIAPLILLPFVENAFKHGAGETRFRSFIHIRLMLRGGMLTFAVENSRDPGAAETITENIGLRNVRRQLELIYPGHEINISNREDVFSVLLTINLLNHASISMPDH